MYRDPGSAKSLRAFSGTLRAFIGSYSSAERAVKRLMAGTDGEMHFPVRKTHSDVMSR